MTIVRWRPFQELDTIERRMRRLFDEMGVVPAPLPAADVWETDKEVVFELEVPGFEEQDVAVEVSDHTLTVKGIRKEEKEQKEKEFLLHERLAKEFVRRFDLPMDTDTEKVAAEFTKGVLTVHAPKVAEATPRKIPIGAKR